MRKSRARKSQGWFSSSVMPSKTILTVLGDVSVHSHQVNGCNSSMDHIFTTSTSRLRMLGSPMGVSSFIIPSAHDSLHVMGQGWVPWPSLVIIALRKISIWYFFFTKTKAVQHEKTGQGMAGEQATKSNCHSLCLTPGVLKHILSYLCASASMDPSPGL